MTAEVKAAAAVHAVAEYVFGALAYPLGDLNATTARMLGALGIDRSATVAETEAALLTALGFAPACNCVIGGWDLLPACCKVHGIPCEDCGGVESCMDDCGEVAR